MNLPKLSTNGLLMLHTPISTALAQDDSIPNGQPKVYGVRETADWREWATEIEAELDSRHVAYDKIKW
jgi:hypothetical protein